MVIALAYTVRPMKESDMHANRVGWVMVVVVAVVMGAALVKTNLRIATLEAQLDKVDGNFVQLSVPVEETVRDISAIYSELDRIRVDYKSTADLPRTGRDASALSATPLPPQRRQPVVSSYEPPVYYEESSDRYEVPGADGLTIEQRQRQIQARMGTFNDITPDGEHDE
jgi:hypothetical protein